MMEKKIGIIGHDGSGLATAIEACAQSNDRGIDIVNVDEVRRSPFAPEPTMLIKNYRMEELTYTTPTVIGGQKKFRKKNNRKKHNRK